MADISVGSIIFAVAAFVVICTSVLLLLRHYLPLRTTPAYLLVPVFLALALPSSIIILVPIDLASAENELLEGKGAGVWLPERALLATWRITYWLTFVLTWVILPILGEYCDSGDREPQARVMYSLRSNLKYQLITIGVGVIGLVYFILDNGFSVESIRGLVMALAYAWGLFLAIGLMGHGLVMLPKRLYKSSRVSDRLRHLQSRAPMLKEKLDEAREELNVLEHTVMQLKRRKNSISGDMQDWIDELADTCSIPEPRAGTMTPIRDGSSIPAVVSEKYLAELTRKLKRSRHKTARFENEWTGLCAAAVDTQAILDAASTQSLEFSSRQSHSLLTNMLSKKARFYLHFYVIPYVSISLAVFLAIASAGIVWSEVTAAFLPRISLIGITTLPSIDGKFGFVNQIIAAAWLLYMCTTTLYALSDVKVWGNRALVKRHTYGESACWYALQVAKLTVPLSYNFITMMPARKLYEHTGFYHLLGQYVNLTPLGTGFSLFFPCFIVLSASASLFNLYGKIQNTLGFGILEDDDEDGKIRFGNGSWQEGRTLIDREVQGGSSSNLGLPARGDSLDIERQARVGARPGDAAPRTFNPITNEEDVDESPRHFYQDLGERMRNTFDTAETPRWMRNIGSNFKAPKWLKTDQQDGSQGESGIGGWFRSQSGDGRVRL